MGDGQGMNFTFLKPTSVLGTLPPSGCLPLPVIVLCESGCRVKHTTSAAPALGLGCGLGLGGVGS